MQSLLWRLTRWPLLVLAVAGVLLAAAAILEQTPAYEWSLTIGAPALVFLAPLGALWLLLALIRYAILRSGGSHRRP